MGDFALPTKNSVCLKNQFTTRQSTSVLYDFSIVRKARFYVYTIGDNGSKILNKAGPQDILFVQINPKDLDVSVDSARRITSPSPNVKGDIATIAPASTDKKYQVEDMTISLIYDVYDQYSLATADGAAGNITGDVGLKSREATSMEKLIEYSRMQNIALLFKWGTIEFFGTISNLNFQYTAFSRWGDPLKASGSITLRAFGFEVGANGAIEYTLLDKSREKITQITEAEDVALTVGMMASQALR